MSVEKGRAEVNIPVRPDFGSTQVKAVEEIVVGETYIDRHEINQEYAGGRFTVTEAPYKNGQGWCVKGVLEAPYLEEKAQVEWPLVHHSVTPYPDGTWNRASWMEDPEKVPPAGETPSQ